MAVPMFTLTKEGFVLEVGERFQAVEIFVCENLDAAGFGDNPTDAETLLYSFGLPAYGTPHPDPKLPGAIVRRKRVIYGPTQNRCKVAAFYDSWVRFRFGNYTSRWTGRSGEDPMVVPIINNKVWHNQIWGVRSWSERQLTIFSAAFDPDKTQQTIFENTGCWYFFKKDAANGAPDYSVSGDVIPDAGVPVRLVGGGCEDLGNGMKKATYIFRTTGKVLARAAADVGSEVNLPALSYLEEYAVRGTANGYTIAPDPVPRRYPKGNALPTGNYFNPLP